VRIIIADRDVIYRRTMKLLLMARPSLEVVGEAKNKDELLSQVADLNPDLVILDGDLSGWDTCNLISALHQIADNLGLIIMDGRPQIETDALNSGADAFFLKGTSSRFLFASIESIRLLKESN